MEIIALKSMAMSYPPNTPPSHIPPSQPSSQELARRRQFLRAKRRFNFYKAAWRSLAILGLAAGTLWLATSPIWLIRGAEQIAVSDNQILSDANIQALLPVPYPQSLLKVKPEGLAQALVSYAPIESAVVTRRLVPPGLHVRVRERVPVAAVMPDTTKPVKAIPSQPVPFKEAGLIDAEGNWMPLNSFRELGAIAPPPNLTVKGLQANQRSAWRSLYKSLQRSPVKITAIDWTRPSNIILYSELGQVHIGPYGKNFDAQLTALDKMRSIDSKVNPQQVAFIDLQNPENPVVEILQATNGAAEAAAGSPQEPDAL
jgi:cell division protein FtsQ